MGFGFRKSFKIAPGVRLNVSNKSFGVSAGTKGLRYSVNSYSGTRVTAGIPGTGISYSRQFSSASYNKRAQLLQRELAKLEAQERAIHEVELFLNTLEVITSVHKECDTPVNWKTIKISHPPFSPGKMGPKESAAQSKLDVFKPGFFDKLFGKAEKQRSELTENVVRAQNEDRNDYERWEYMVNTANRVLDGDIDTYIEVIEDFAPLDDLSDFGSGFEVFVDPPSSCEVDFEVNPETVIPKDVKTLTKTGKVSVKPMTKTQYYDLFQDYVCSSAIRIARDMFAILPFEEVFVHAYDYQLNTKTGHTERVCVLSVRIDKTTLNQINLNTIDCSDSMENFQHNMKFKKTTGLSAVDKIQPVSSLSS